MATGMMRKLWAFLMVAIAAGTSSYVLVKTLVPRRYKAKAVLVKSGANLRRESLGALAIGRMLELPDVLRELRRRLHIPLKLGDIEDRLTVDVNPSSGLIVVTYSDEDPRRAALTLGTLLDIFLEKVRGVAEEQARNKTLFFRRKLESVRAEERRLERRLREFKEKHKIVDIGIETVGLLDRLYALDTEYNALKVEARKAAIKLHELDAVMEKVRKALERSGAQIQDADTTLNLKQKMERLKERIKELKTRRELELKLREVESKLARAKRLSERGYLPAIEVEELELERALLLNRLDDGEDIAKLKRRIARIDELLAPTAPGRASDALAKEYVMRRFELMLEEGTLSKRAEVILKEKRELEGKLRELPAVEFEYAELLRNLHSLEHYEEVLLENVDRSRAQEGSVLSPVRIVDEPRPPHKPSRSKAKLIFLASFAAQCGAGSLLVLAWILYASRKISSESQLARTSGLPVLGTLDAIMLSAALRKRGGAAAMRRLLLALVRKREAEGEGLAVMLTSTGTGMPLSDQLAAALAAALEDAGWRCGTVPSDIPAADAMQRIRNESGGMDFLFVCRRDMEKDVSVSILKWYCHGTVVIIPAGFLEPWRLWRAIDTCGLHGRFEAAGVLMECKGLAEGGV